jgi:hypothetical protein
MEPYRESGGVVPRLPAALHALLDAELQPGERLIWAGVPSAGRLRARAASDFVFPLLHNAAIATLIYFVAKFAGMLCMVAIPLLLLGFGLLTGPFLAFKNATRTLYALTDRRALVFEDVEVVHVDRARIRNAVSKVRPDGSGDVVFVDQSGVDGTVRIGFYGIADVARVAALLVGAC